MRMGPIQKPQQLRETRPGFRGRRTSVGRALLHHRGSPFRVWRKAADHCGIASTTSSRHSACPARRCHAHHFHGERRTDVNKKSIKSDLARLDRMTDADIDYSDIPELDEAFFKN